MAEDNLLVTEGFQAVGAVRVGAQETAVAGVLVVDQQGRVEVRQPFEQQVVGDRGIFLDVFGDQVAVGRLQIVAADRQRPQVLAEGLQLQREIQQVVRQAVFAEVSGAFLGVSVDAHLPGVADPGGVQALADLGIGEANRGGFVEVIDDLAVQAVAVDGDGIEVALLLDHGTHQVRHVVLRRLQGEECWRLVGVGKTCRSGDQRPEELDHALRQPADGNYVDHAAGRRAGGAQGGVVWRGQGALRHDQQDSAAGDAVLHQG